MKRAGWAGIQCLPRDIGLRPDGRLSIQPIPELRALRTNPRTLSRVTVRAGAPVMLDRIRGDCLELEA